MCNVSMPTNLASHIRNVLLSQEEMANRVKYAGRVNHTHKGQGLRSAATATHLTLLSLYGH